MSRSLFRAIAVSKSMASALTEAPVSTNYKKVDIYVYDAQTNGGIVR